MATMIQRNAILQADSVGLAFNSSGPLVLQDISFRLDRGSFTSILGPSGCGKTTLLRILAGLLPPSSGTVYFNGEPVTGPGPERTIIFQDYGLFEWKTVAENVEVGLKAKGLGKLQRRLLAQQYIDLVHLSGSEFKYPKHLSGGMKQRAAIARALAVDPECILMDEPFAALDSQTRLLLQEEIMAVWEKAKKTVVLVTHSAEEAVLLSDRVLVLSNAPASIVLDLNIDFERPRPSELRRDHRFLELTNSLWQCLRSEVGIGAEREP